MIPSEFIDELLARTDVAVTVGRHVELKKAGSLLKGLCPFHGEKTPSFTVSPSRQTYHCFGCGAHGNAIGFLREHAGLGFIDAVRELADEAGMAVPGDDDRSTRQGAPRRRPTAKPLQRPEEPAQHETLSAWGRELWNACRPLSGTARAYLDARACVIPPADGDLRWHPELRHAPSDYVGPALVALVTDAITREPLTLHRTWVRADGRKAECGRMHLSGHRKAGGVIRLWPDEAVTTGLAVGEGVETALSLARDYAPAWSLIDASNLTSFPVLPGIETLVIGADHDKHGKGIEAARKCADRWASAGVEVHVIAPDIVGTDWNDARAAA